MTINDPEAYMRGVWDWSILDGCFGKTAIEPTDIDGLVERNGNFLILETKSPTAHLPKGQEIMFRAFVEKAGAVVIVIWGEQNQPERLRVFSRKYPNGTDIAGSIELLRGYVEAWFKRADKRTAA